MFDLTKPEDALGTIVLSGKRAGVPTEVANKVKAPEREVRTAAGQRDFTRAEDQYYAASDDIDMAARLTT